MFYYRKTWESHYYDAELFIPNCSQGGNSSPEKFVLSCCLGFGGAVWGGVNFAPGGVRLEGEVFLRHVLCRTATPGGACVWSACGAHDSQPRHLGRPVRIRPYWPLGLHQQTPRLGLPAVPEAVSPRLACYRGGFILKPFSWLAGGHRLAAGALACEFGGHAVQPIAPHSFHCYC